MYDEIRFITKHDGLDFRTTKIWIDDNAFILHNFTRDIIEEDIRAMFIRRGYKYGPVSDKIVKDVDNSEK